MPISTKFKKLLEETRDYYAGRKVPKEYQVKYGKVYSREEAERIAYAIVRQRKWRV